MAKPRILLVDDDEIYLHFTEKILKSLSNKLQVIPFHNGRKAMDFLYDCLRENASIPNIILLDVHMPLLDGWGFLTEFKKISIEHIRNVHIHMVTSSENQRDDLMVKEIEELMGYVIKPISEDKLVEILTKAYGHKW